MAANKSQFTHAMCGPEKYELQCEKTK